MFLFSHFLNVLPRVQIGGIFILLFKSTLFKSICSRVCFPLVSTSTPDPIPLELTRQMRANSRGTMFLCAS